MVRAHGLRLRPRRSGLPTLCPRTQSVLASIAAVGAAVPIVASTSRLASSTPLSLDCQGPMKPTTLRVRARAVLVAAQHKLLAIHFRHHQFAAQPVSTSFLARKNEPYSVAASPSPVPPSIQLVVTSRTDAARLQSTLPSRLVLTTASLVVNRRLSVSTTIHQTGVALRPALPANPLWFG